METVNIQQVCDRAYNLWLKDKTRSAEENWYLADKQLKELALFSRHYGSLPPLGGVQNCIHTKSQKTCPFGGGDACAENTKEKERIKKERDELYADDRRADEWRRTLDRRSDEWWPCATSYRSRDLSSYDIGDSYKD